MSNNASNLLKIVEFHAQQAASYPAFWVDNAGQLTPDLYQIDLALATLEGLEHAVNRAKKELESIRPAAQDTARAKWQAATNV